MIVTLNQLRKILELPIKTAGKYPIRCYFLIKSRVENSRWHIFFTIFDEE
jgi:hypothetical protein